MISSYISFCVDSVLDSKIVKVYANDKPWINSSLKALLHRRQEAFAEGDKKKEKSAQLALSRKITEGKRLFTSRVENHFKEKNARQYWKDITTMTGCRPKPSHTYAHTHLNTHTHTWIVHKLWCQFQTQSSVHHTHMRTHT